MKHLKLTCAAAALALVSCTALADDTTSIKSLSASGMTPSEMGSKVVMPLIVGGVEVEEFDKAAHQVALVWANTRNQYCGGTIIGKTWVLTAAHCVDLRFSGLLENDDLDVVTGTLTFSSGGHKVDVEKIHIHPNWDRNTLNYDAALLKLSSAVQSGFPISIHSSDTMLTTANTLEVTGWGALSEGGPGSMVLMQAAVPYVENSTCNEVESYDGRVTGVMMCAGKSEGGVDACQGDSGGPIVGEVDGKNTLVGIVSWGDGCARRLKYGVYTRVSEISDWVETTKSSN